MTNDHVIKTIVSDGGISITTRKFCLEYDFSLHCHPFADELMRLLSQRSLSALQDVDTQYSKTADGSVERLENGKPKPLLYKKLFGTKDYQPSSLVNLPFPIEELDFSTKGAYSTYNWEIFFHAPLAVAINLSKNQCFAEAQRWFHFIFDPTDDSDDSSPERFWKVKPLREANVKKTGEIFLNLSTGQDSKLQEETIRSIEAWQNNPFKPHVVARFRHQAYMYKTIMAYLDNLIAWADSLFRVDMGESIDEALMLYILAANILGPRPQELPQKKSRRPQTYDNLRKDLDRFGNSLREMENELPFTLLPQPMEGKEDERSYTHWQSMGKALYFSLPYNEKLLSYWDIVADRLFKIRNSLNLQGVFRPLPLFAPPLDPGMMAKATAAGLDVDAIASGYNQPLPLVRFRYLVQKAAEICHEVKSLGMGLLSAMEKEDVEELALLRSKHERALFASMEQVHFAQWQEAIKAREGLLQSLAVAHQRYVHFERLLGREASEISVPELNDFDVAEFESMAWDMVEPELEKREAKYDFAQSLSMEERQILSSYEKKELEFLKEAHYLNESAATINMVASAVSLLPEFGANMHFMGLGANICFGGSSLSRMHSLIADNYRVKATQKAYEANRLARLGSYSNREREWTYQSNLAAGEISVIHKQLRAAQIREAVAEKELANHRLRMEHSEDIEYFLNSEGMELKGKKTNKALYSWLRKEIKGLYSQCFQLAFDTAKKAERALQHELQEFDSHFIQYNHLAGKKSLLAGEKLYLEIKRMELAYLDLNRRKYEMVKHVSLSQVDPLALLELRTTGRCNFRLPESLFDLDGPGQFCRRIKSVAVTLPCITGPYTGVNCRLTLTKSTIRRSANLTAGTYRRIDTEDERFEDYYGSMESIVTSSGQYDSGLFETNFADERYLPFEGAGVESEWRLQLPANPAKGDPCQFDYRTISDVILHVAYTAQEGGDALRIGALRNLQDEIKDARATGSLRMFSMRHDFPTEWAKFKNSLTEEGKLYRIAISLRNEHYPYWSQGFLGDVKDFLIFANSSQALLEVYDKENIKDSAIKKDILTQDDRFGNILAGRLTNISLPKSPLGKINLYLADRDIEDFWFVIAWGS